MFAEEQIHSTEVTLLVHEFCSSEGLRHRRKQQVLNDGLRLVASEIVGQPISFCDIHESKTVNSFIYNKKPPSVSFVGTVPVIKEWGSPVSEYEVFTINDLEPFRTTGIDEDHPKDIDPTSLQEIIPQPHLHPSPFLPKEPPLKGRPFDRNKPEFVTPYSTFSLQDHARVAWLVPIRGVFPWSGCTSASVSSLSMPSPVNDNLISWNRTSLLAFWQLLLELQKSGSLGPIGISLHTMRTVKAKTDDRKIQRAAITNPISTTPLGPLSQTLECRRRCSAVEHFKIYHDSSRAFYVRNAFDFWSYRTSDGTKVRVLKGARFPLLDEVSATILVC